VLQQARYHLNHDTAEQLSSQQNTDSYTFQSRPTELNFQKSHDYSNRTWLNCLKLSCCCGVQGGSDGRVARTAGHYVNDKEVYWEARYGVIVANHHKDQNLFATVHSVFSFGYNGVQRKGVDCAIQHLAIVNRYGCDIQIAAQGKLHFGQMRTVENNSTNPAVPEAAGPWLR
jgi:hypothetical protein